MPVAPTRIEPLSTSVLRRLSRATAFVTSSAGGSTFDYAKRQDALRDASRVGDVYRDGGGQVRLQVALAELVEAVGDGGGGGAALNR